MAVVKDGRQGPATTIYARILEMDDSQLADFRRRMRRRYSRDEILVELRSCASRLGVSPTMREFADDPETTIHPQTVVEHFETWNKAKREAGLLPRRRLTREELVESLVRLGDEIGQTPQPADLESRRGIMPGRSVFVRTFGSWEDALREAGYDAPTRDERLIRSIQHGAEFLTRTGRMPSFREWERIRGDREDIMTSWQIYRTFESSGGAWSAFQFAISEHADSGSVKG